MIFTSCNKPSSETPVIPEDPPVAPPALDSVGVTLSLDPSVLSLSDAATKVWIHVNSNRIWSVGCTDKWCVPSKRSGNHTDSVELVIDKNTLLEGRKTSVVFRAGDILQTLEINQEAEAPVIILPTKHVEISSSPRPFSVEFKTNIPLDITTPEWIVKDVANGIGVGAGVGVGSRFIEKHYLTFYASNNPNAEQREGLIIFKSTAASGDISLSDTVFVTQTGMMVPIE